MSEEAWYYVDAGERIGPVGLNAIASVLAARPHPENLLVWTSGFSGWVVAGEIDELRALIPPPLPGKDPAAMPQWKVRWWWLIIAILFLGSVGSRDGRKAMQWSSLERMRRRKSGGKTQPVQVEHQAQSQPESAGAERRPTSKNYIARHWRGNLSLPVSYWVNGFLGNIIAAVAVVFLTVSMDSKEEFRPELALLGLTAAWTTIVIVAIWQVVGVWRSASNYSNNNIRTYWGGVAKFMVFLAAVKLSAQLLTNGIPQIAEYAKIYSGDEGVGKYKFLVLNNGQELEFTGGITFGAAKAFEAFADALTGLKTIRLTSNGGRISEADRIAEQIRRRGLNTYVPTYCVSACTILFLSGRERFVGSSSQLGFHQPDFPGMSPEERRQIIAAEERRLTSLGVSVAFAQKANSTPPSKMWYPTLSELLSERIATKALDIDDSAVAYEPFASTEGRFSVNFGGVPKTKKESKLPANDITYDSYSWSTGGKTVYKAVSLFIYSKPSSFNFDSAIAGAAESSNAQVVSQKRISLGGVEGREVVFHAPESIGMKIRMFYVKDRFYQVLFVANSGSVAFLSANEFLDSFRFKF